MYYLCSEDADQLSSYCTADLCHCFSPMYVVAAAHMESKTFCSAYTALMHLPRHT